MGARSNTKRAVLAGVLTALAVAPFEAVSIYMGAYPGWWIGLLVAPLVSALTFYSSPRARLLAWALLSLLAFLVGIALDLMFWFV